MSSALRFLVEGGAATVGGWVSGCLGVVGRSCSHLHPSRARRRLLRPLPRRFPRPLRRLCHRLRSRTWEKEKVSQATTSRDQAGAQPRDGLAISRGLRSSSLDRRAYLTPLPPRHLLRRKVEPRALPLPRQPLSSAVRPCLEVASRGGI